MAKKSSHLSPLKIISVFFLMAVSFETRANDRALEESVSSRRVRSHLNSVPELKLGLPHNEGGSQLMNEKALSEVTLGFGTESYLNRETPPSGVSDFNQIYMRLRTRTEKGPMAGRLELGGSFATDVENYSNIEVPEAYFGWERERPDVRRIDLQISAGRRRELWSRLDRDWQLGLSQPLNRFDALRPTEQGLTGLFVGFAGANAEVMAFVSPIFIPEQGAPYELESGQFKSHSPWFSKVPSRLVLLPGTDPADVRYKLKTPTVGSVINHVSAGLLLRVYENGRDQVGLYGQMSFLKKPRNDLSLPFEGHLQLTNETSYGDVTVYPKVVYHNLGAIEFGYQSRDFALRLSALVDESDPPDIPAQLTYQNYENLYMLSPSFEIRTFPSKYWAPVLRLSYLHSIGGATSMVGPLASNDGFFSSRTPFREAMSLTSESLVYRQGRWSLSYGLRWIEEFSESGTILMNDLQLNISDVWRVMVSADVMGSRQPVDATSTFMSQFRGNDRFLGRVTYAF